MIAYQVNDMTCGHCVSTITKAVKWVDPTAQVAIDQASKRVEISSNSSSAPALKDAIVAAGYTPVDATAGKSSPAPAKAGGCCGCH